MLFLSEKMVVRTTGLLQPSSWGIKHGAGVGSYYQNTSRFVDLRRCFVGRRAFAFGSRGEQTAVGTGSGCVRR